MINKDHYLAPWWVRKHSHRLRVLIASWALIGMLIGLSMLLAWIMIGCGTVRPCKSYRAGIDQGTYWDACFSPSSAQDEEEYGQIINSMTWER